MTGVTCQYCKQPAKLVDAEVLYHNRKDLKGKKFWYCETDQAWVSCHPGTEEPLGSLAKAGLRRLRGTTHGFVDRFWRKLPKDQREEARSGVYAWLSKEMGYEVHIGQSNEQQCELIIQLCKQRNRTEFGDGLPCVEV